MVYLTEDSDNLVESEVEWDDDGEKVKSGVDSRPSTPVPFWLKTEDEEIIPELKLPKSSDDLMIDPGIVGIQINIFSHANIANVLILPYL